MNMGMTMTSWYDIYELADNDHKFKTSYERFSQQEMDHSFSIISKFIAEEAELLGSPSKVFVGGFSQGCAMALMTHFNYPVPIGGTIGLSGAQCYDIDWSKVNIEERNKTPMLLCHGTMDPMIPIKFAKQQAKIMEDHGVKFEFKDYPGLQHSLDMGEIRDIKNWLSEKMI